MSNMNLTQLAQEIHAAAVEKGFWNVEDATSKHLAKMISELGEVVQADRAGVMYEVEREGSKPEGVVAELADFVMMTLDLMMQVEFSVPEEDVTDWSDEKDAAEKLGKIKTHEFVCSLAAELISISEYTTNEPFLYIIFCTHEWLRVHGYDLWDIIRQKMEYNKTRPMLHGRAY